LILTFSVQSSTFGVQRLFVEPGLETENAEAIYEGEVYGSDACSRFGWSFVLTAPLRRRTPNAERRTPNAER